MSLVPSADDPTKPGLNSRQSARDFLLGRINYERMVSVPYTKRHMKLDRMRELLTRLGNPDAGLPIVHVAGTKGKGSTAAMIARILHAAGYNTGLFASPHLEDISERFVVNGIPCPVAELEVLVEQLRPVVEEMDREVHTKRTVGLTYFELTTAIALMFFAKRKVDIAVLEVGLGGRLDSTNVCQSTLSVITNISLDHTKQLGDTVEAIAAEKAGIIKPGVPVLCGDLEPGPRRVIAEIARQHGSRLFEEGQDFFHTYQPPRNLEREDSRGLLRFTGVLGGESIELSDISLNLFGAHQAANAALAIAVCARLRRQGWSISWESICGAFSSICKAQSENLSFAERRRIFSKTVDETLAAFSAKALLRLSFPLIFSPYRGSRPSSIVRLICSGKIEQKVSNKSSTFFIELPTSFSLKISIAELISLAVVPSPFKESISNAFRINFA